MYQIYYWKNVGNYSVDLGDIVAFSSSYSFAPGETVPIFAHTTEDAKARLFRLGHEREDTGREVSVPRTLQSNTYDIHEGVDWTAVAHIDTTGLKPGLYAIEIAQADREVKPYWMSFVLKPHERKPIAVIASTHTWESYNAFGGISRYENRRINPVASKLIKRFNEELGIRTPSAVVARRRPNQAVSHDLLNGQDPMQPAFSKLVRGEWALIAFLEREGYDYGIYTDIDMEMSSDIRDAAVLVLNGHCEYWTQAMLYKLENYIHRGGRVVVAAGNPVYRPVEMNDAVLRFEMEDLPRAHVSSLIGAFFTNDGQGDAAPFEVVTADHWVFDGTGLTKGAVFGERSLSLPLRRPPPNGAAYPDGASGGYTSKIGEGSGAFIRLANGRNPIGAANMVFADTEAGGWVFNASSFTFTGALLIDPIIARITRNLLDDATSESPRKKFVEREAEKQRAYD